jgi:tryptophan halogenase
MTTPAMKEVVIVGRDAAFWLSVCVVQAALAPAGVKVTAVALPSRLGPSDFYASQPALEALHGRLRINEAQLVANTGGSFSLGQNFTSPSGTVPAFFHAYGAYGSLVADKPFLPHWLLARRFGLPTTLEDFALNAAAAKQGRMLIPDPAVHSYGRADYAYHFPAVEYVAALTRHAASGAVTLHNAARCDVELGADGSIAALKLDNDARIGGHLFIDASGSDAQLMAALGVQRESWRDHFIADRVLHAAAPRFASIPPYAEIRTWDQGWVALFPNQARTHVTHAYASSLTSDEEALRVASQVAGLELQDAAVRVSSPSRCHQAWHRNCVAIGESASVLDPMHSVDLHAIQLGLVHWLSLFPMSDDYDAERYEYNRVMQASFERIRDFQCAHYTLCRHEGRTVVPEPLRHKIETFRARGDLPMYEHESFTADSWHALFIGHRVVPETLGPMVETTSPDTMKHEFRRMLGFVKDTVLRQPTHGAYLRALANQGGAS